MYVICAIHMSCTYVNDTRTVVHNVCIHMVYHMDTYICTCMYTYDICHTRMYINDSRYDMHTVVYMCCTQCMYPYGISYGYIHCVEQYAYHRESLIYIRV